MTAPPREPQNLYDALSTIYDWLCDDRLTQWPYMENGPFYSDLPKYQEVARAALAAAPAPSAEPPAQAATDDGFDSWWRASKYCQVVCPERGWEQIARDGYRAGVERQAREIARLDARNLELCHGWSSQNERAERAEAERDAMRECVRELVACADESDSLAAERLYGKPHTPEYNTRELDHRQRSIEAWKAARAMFEHCLEGSTLQESRDAAVRLWNDTGEDLLAAQGALVRILNAIAGADIPINLSPESQELVHACVQARRALAASGEAIVKGGSNVL